MPPLGRSVTTAEGTYGTETAALAADRSKGTLFGAWSKSSHGIILSLLAIAEELPVVKTRFRDIIVSEKITSTFHHDIS